MRNYFVLQKRTPNQGQRVAPQFWNIKYAINLFHLYIAILHAFLLLFHNWNFSVFIVVFGEELFGVVGDFWQCSTDYSHVLIILNFYDIQVMMETKAGTLIITMHLKSDWSLLD